MAKKKADAVDMSPQFQAEVAAFRAKVNAELDFLHAMQALIAAGRDDEAEVEMRAYYQDETDTNATRRS